MRSTSCDSGAIPNPRDFPVRIADPTSLHEFEHAIDFLRWRRHTESTRLPGPHSGPYLAAK
ncbi:MAG TPA: hypothetical protein P5081_24105 [Phycisphaerae bacterium]|nr:hypothetical protein [Phycisphaerae bacterium]HRW55970.1 hypothetical protein [Phycisphaerae bacterium]